MPSPYPCPATQVYVTDSSIVVDAPDLVQGKRVVLIEDGPTLTHGGMKYGAGKYAAEKYGAAEIVDPRLFLVRVIAAAFVWGGLRRALAPAPGACVHSAGGRCSLLTIQCCSVLPCPRASVPQVGSMLYTYRKHLHLGKLIPAMGYYPEQASALQGCRAVGCGIWVPPRLLGCTAAPPPRHWALCLVLFQTLPCLILRPPLARRPCAQQIADLEASINAVPCDAVVIATPMDLRKVINIHKPATAVRPLCAGWCWRRRAGVGAGGWRARPAHSRLLPAPTLPPAPTTSRCRMRWRTGSRRCCGMRWPSSCSAAAAPPEGSRPLHAAAIAEGETS